MKILAHVLLLTSVMGIHPVESSPQKSCFLIKLAINPIEPQRKDLYIGVGRSVQIEFHNNSLRDPVRVFPESPLTVRQLGNGKTCQIEGGIWARNSVFLTANENTLVLLEFSGASNHLLAYETVSCRIEGDIDVSDAVWKVEGSRIVVGTGCASRNLMSCSKKQIVPVSTLCHPLKTL